MSHSRRTKRVQGSSSEAERPTPLVGANEKPSAGDLLNEDRANELRELVQLLLDTIDEAPQAILTLCKKIKLHPDPVLVMYMRAWGRTARLQHRDFLETVFFDVFPIKLPSIIILLKSRTRPTSHANILHEIRILKDRCDRAISAVHRIIRFWDGVELSLRERSNIDHANESSRNSIPRAEGSIYSATIGLLSHVFLIQRHLEHLLSLLQRFVEFWRDYLIYLGPIDLDNDTQSVDNWSMHDLFGQVLENRSTICTQLGTCDPSIYWPDPGAVDWE